NKMWVIGGIDGSIDKNDVWYCETTASNFPVHLPLAQKNATLEVNAVLNLAATAEILYNDGSSIVQNLSWSVLSGSGSLAGNSYTAPAFTEEAVLSASYTEGLTTLESTMEVQVIGAGSVWQQATAAAAFPIRSSHAMLAFGGKMWVIAGTNDTSDLNDAWYSTDGAGWTQATAAASFSARAGHSCTVYDGRMWLVGGNDSGNLNDVWCSEDGSAWTQVAVETSFTGRIGHACVSYDNRLWLIGGSDGDGMCNDVWYSYDGADWTMATAAAAFSARAAHVSFIWDNKMWVIGGQEAGSVNLNDAWYSTDGVSWTMASTSPLYTARYMHTGVVYNGGLWVIGGDDGSVRSDVWNSFDAASWSCVTATAGFTPRRGLKALAYGGKMWVTGGFDGVITNYNDVWHSGTMGAVLTPSHMETSLKTMEVVMSATVELSSISALVYYNDGTTIEAGSVSLMAIGGGSIDGTVFTAPANTAEVTIEVSYTESGHTITANIPVSVVHYGSQWFQATAGAAWSPRCDGDSLVFDGKVWMIAGDSGGYSNDVWYSTDGAVWTQATAAAAFSARQGVTCLVYDGRMWMIGGFDGSYRNDVWYSQDGSNWYEATAEAAFSGRISHTCVAFNNRMWVIGGGQFPATYHNDVWYSYDGINWIQATAAAGFSSRWFHTSLVYDNKMWVIAGDDSWSQNDVWYSTDGCNWTQATAGASFITRNAHSSTVYDGKMWVIGGDNDGYCLNDVWCSIDGADWTQITASAEFSARLCHLSVTYDNRMWVLGGVDSGDTFENDVWYCDHTAETFITEIYLSASQAVVGPGQELNLLSIEVTAVKNDGTTQEVSGAWSQVSGGGVFAGNTYTAPLSMDTAELLCTYTEGPFTMTRELIVRSLFKMVFHTDRNGSHEIYTMYSDGSNQTRLTTHVANDIDPSYSPDGSKILFVSERDGHGQVYVMNADGSGQTNLSNNAQADYKAKWLPDGQRIIFHSYRDGNAEVYIMNADGSGQTNLSNNAAEDTTPAVSPDGSKIAFKSDRDGNSEIYIMNIDGSNPVNITNNAALDSTPGFSPDGNRVTFYSVRDGNEEIYMMNADGSGQTRLTTSGTNDRSPVFSPDGSMIAFQTDRDGNYEAYIMDADGSNQHNVSNHASNDWFPAFAPYTGLSSPLLTCISLDTYETVVTSGEDFDLSTIVVKAFYSDGSTAEVSGSWSKLAGVGTVSVNLYSAPVNSGTAELVCSYTESSINRTREIRITNKKLIDLGGGVSMEMAWIPAGTSIMGSTAGWPDETPVHTVEITQGFWLGKFEVTQSQWLQIQGSNPSNSVAPNYPVESVSWNDCQLFITNLNGLGQGVFRLPTEAEWEYACRAGTSTEHYWGDPVDGNYLWDTNNSGGIEHNVGEKLPNAWGLYDMSGNVWEWVNDWYDSGYYSASPLQDPTGPGSGTEKVFRSGCYSYSDCRSARRNKLSPSSVDSGGGMRVLLETP
ncbi:MAG: SUMF1/EgtB/PvdO family nonheme iron enzyme, partial [Candidatus Wallbacteria bacterium]|nr:SUMF1/EgtB/PvdO family nonheme iron enzyme [Candidatus Wallbacteria bacterium]